MWILHHFFLTQNIGSGLINSNQTNDKQKQIIDKDKKRKEENRYWIQPFSYTRSRSDLITIKECGSDKIIGTGPDLSAIPDQDPIEP